MKKFLSILLALSMAVVMVLSFAGCTDAFGTEAERSTHNVQKEADKFNVTRRLTVINMRSDSVILELVGNFSISNNMNAELVVTSEVEEGKYKVDYVYLNDWTMYTVEDLSGANVSQYHYEINYLPEMLQPFEISTKD